MDGQVLRTNESLSEAQQALEQVQLIKFTSRVLDSLAHNLSNYGLPRIYLNNEGNINQFFREAIIDQAQQSSDMMDGFATEETSPEDNESFAVAKQVMGELATHTRVYHRPRLNLRKIGVQDPQRKEYGLKLTVAHKVMASLLVRSTVDQKP